VIAKVTGNAEVKSPIRILAVDGGGVGGIIPARLIERLNSADPRLIANADVVAGTSTGGLIALGLAGGVEPPAICDLYRDKAKYIFSSANERYLVERPFRAKFQPDGLRDAINAITGGRTLGELTAKAVVIPVTAVRRPDQKHRPAGIFLSTAFRLTGKAELEKYASSRWSSVDVALATAAAPTFFPAHEVSDPAGRGSWVCWDGGIVANDPSMAAFGEILRLELAERGGISRSDPSEAPDVRVLSFGTGYRDIPIDAGDWGFTQTPIPLIRALMDASVGSSAFLMRQLLGVRALRVNVPLTEDYEIDDPGVVDQLNTLATDYAENGIHTVGQPDGSTIDVGVWLDQFWFS
jgi:hypothetical protein